MQIKKESIFKIATVYTTGTYTESPCTGESYLTSSVGVNDLLDQQLTANLYQNSTKGNVSIKLNIH